MRKSELFSEYDNPHNDSGQKDVSLRLEMSV